MLLHPDMDKANEHPVLPLLTSESTSIQQKMLANLRQALPNEYIDTIDNLPGRQLAQADVAIVANPVPAMFEQLPKLTWVQSMWAGVENMLDDAERNDFKIARLIDPKLTHSMTEAALAWTLYLHRRMPEYSRLQAKKRWQQLPYQQACDYRVSILGLGELGKACATRLSSNGFSVSGWSRSAKSLPNISCYTGPEGLQQMLCASDLLIILLPLTPATRGLVNSQTLAVGTRTSDSTSAYRRTNRRRVCGKNSSQAHNNL